MKNKRIIVLVLSIIIWANMFSVKAYSGDHWTYDSDRKILTITGNGSVSLEQEEIQFFSKQVETISIQEGVTSFGVDCDDDEMTLFTNVKTVTIPSTIMDLDSIKTFLYWPSIKTLDISDKNPSYSSVDGIILNKDKTVLYAIPDNAKTVTIPASVKTIDEEGLLADDLRTVIFKGDAPSIKESSMFSGDIVFIPEELSYTAYYTIGETWTPAQFMSYGANITWIGTTTESKSTNEITVTPRTLSYSKKKQSFSLNADAKDNAALSYESSSKSVSVNEIGKVTIAKKFRGCAYITVTADATSNYKKTCKTILISVAPKKPSIKSLKSSGKKIKFRLSKEVCSFYEYSISTDKEFENVGYLGEDGFITIKYNKNGYSIGKFQDKRLKKGKKYYIRIRSVYEKKINNYYAWIQSPWAVKSIKVK